MRVLAEVERGLTMRAIRRSFDRVTIVLGGGSTLGRSFHAGVLLSLEQRLAIDPRSVATIVGTSSGSIVAALVAAGLSAQDLFRHEVGDPMSPAGRSLLAEAEAWGSDRRSRLADASLIDSAALRTSSSIGGTLARLVPDGSRRHDQLCSYVDGLYGQRWPVRPDLKLCAVDLRARRRIVLDRAAVRSPGPAVAASCALPGVHAPVHLGDYRLVDGAVHSMDNADLADRSDRDLVVVSSPLSAQRALDPLRPLAGVRNAVRSQTKWELGRTTSACPVVVIQPRVGDIRTMGLDLGTNRRRPAVARKARATADLAFTSFLSS